MESRTPLERQQLKLDWGAWLTRIILVALMGVLITNAEAKSNMILTQISSLQDKVNTFQIENAKVTGTHSALINEHARRLTRLESNSFVPYGSTK